MDIVINEEKLNEVITELNKKINNLNKKYEEINKKVEKTLNNNEVYNSSTKDYLLQYYDNISVENKNSINKLKSLKIFLETTLENYIQSDKSINDDVSKNSDKLTIN